MNYIITYNFEGDLTFIFRGGGVFPEAGIYTRETFDDPEDFYSYFIMGDMEEIVDAVEHNFASVLESVEVQTA